MSKSVYPNANENQVVELSNGDLLMNARNRSSQRTEAISRDGGDTWTKVNFESRLIDPVCQASIFRYSPFSGFDRNIILFSNPHNTEKRVNMAVQASIDDCKMWTYAKTIHAGPTAYSCLTRLPDNRVACLFEAGQKKSYEKIVLASFSIEWLIDKKINTK
jgi:sialidase-1